MNFAEFPLQLVLDPVSPQGVTQKVVKASTNQRVEPVQLTVTDDGASERQSRPSARLLVSLGGAEKASEGASRHQVTHVACEVQHWVHRFRLDHSHKSSAIK